MKGECKMYEIQKAPMLKRISAFLLDFVLMTIAVTGFALLVSLMSGRMKHVDKMAEREAYYEEEYGVDFDISEEDFSKMSEAEQKHLDEAYNAFRQDEEYNVAFSKLISQAALMVTFGFLLAFLLLELAVPILFGNGQTVGKKIFNLGVVHVNAVKLSGVGLFARSILGKYTVETMIPVVLILMMFLGGGASGLLVIALLVILQIFAFFKNKMNTPIHDVLAHTVCVDLSVQLIYRTEQELIDHKLRLHNEIAKEASDD